MATNVVDIPVSPDEVFRTLADGWSYTDWVVGAKEIRDVDATFPDRGSRLHHRVGAGPISLDDATEVVAVDRPWRLRLRASAGIFGEVDIDFCLQPVASGTRVVMCETPIGNDARAAVARRADRALRVRNAESLWRLKTITEGRSTLHPELAKIRRHQAIPRPLADITARLFATAATLRRDRALHPRGLTLEGTGTISDAGRSLADATELRVIVRLSRGVGMPEPLPDFNGVAVRFVDAHGPGLHQDLLLAATMDAPVLRHVIRPVLGFSRSGFTTVLPHRDDRGRLVLFQCRRLPATSLAAARSSLPLIVTLRVAPLLGRWEDAATLTLDRIHSDGDDIRFDPWNTGAGLLPVGLLNRLRAPAYAGSRSAAPGSDIAASGSSTPLVTDATA